jgi:hypothetical protein
MQLATPFLILSSNLPNGKTTKRHSKSTATEAPVPEQATASDAVTDSTQDSHPNNLGKLLASCCDCV